MEKLGTHSLPALVPLSCRNARQHVQTFRWTVCPSSPWDRKVSAVGPLSSSLSSFLLSFIPSVSNSPHLAHFSKLSSFALEISKFQISFHDLNIFTNSGVCCKPKSVSFPSSSASLGPVVRLREENYCLNLHQSVCLFLQFRGGRSFVPTLPKLDIPAQVSFSPETLITSSFKICIPPLLYFSTWYSERARGPSQP